MTGNNYQELAIRTANKLTNEELVLNGVLGLNGESGEIADIMKKYLFQGHDINKTHIIKELGDCLWYIAICAKGLETDLDTIMQINIDKLTARFPDGFDSEKSRNRKKGDI